MKRITIVVVLVLVLAAVVMAQDMEMPEECQPGAVADTLSDFAVQVDKEETDLGAVIDALLALRAGCDDLAFSSEQDGMMPVIGPVMIPEGLYRVTATTSTALIVEVEALTGECAGRSFGSLFNLYGGDSGHTAQQVFESSGCEALITIENTREAWTLDFAKLK